MLTYGTTVAFDILRVFKEIQEKRLQEIEDQGCTIKSNGRVWQKFGY